ncbi:MULTISPECIES: hypothetical protein [Streptomyces]|uniref:Uncharacterized protein n=1 Tax=Streptomyces lichenis TaxID=2306967 RepID=A0ABT0IJX6_9ACTN|nr:hypothetical protein [Streptomyces lichenis]MCK8681640.1 hypothetical protein [Streptomyces lichenis]
MTTAAFTTPQADPPPGRSGATALGTAPHSHPLGNALRALKVFAEAAFGVVVLGEYGQETGVRRR